MATINIDSSSKSRGGPATFPFILGAALGLSLAGSGWLINLVVYMIEEFHLQSIHATQVTNIIYGCSNLLPVIGAVLADSFLGSFAVVFISALSSLLGMTVLTLTATLPSLRPPTCKPGSLLCKPATHRQSAILYIGSALGCIGLGGSRFTIATMGADQFDHVNTKHQEMFFNWYFFAEYSSAIIGSTAIVYVEDNVSWGLGFGLCTLASFLALAVFVAGTRFYVPRAKKQQGSPFTSLVQVVVAAARKMKLASSERREDYYYGPVDGSGGRKADTMLTKGFSFLNKAALLNDNHDNTRISAWKLCRVQQVEDLKSLIRISPLWSTGILLCTSIAINNSLTILQALAMDRRIGSHIKIPAGSMIVFMLASTAASLTFIDRLIYPSWEKLTGRHPTLLQRIGAGHLVNISGMVLSAYVESKRLKRQGGEGRAMSALWLVPQLALLGVGEAFHYAGQVALYYREFPVAFRSTATAMQAVTIGIAYYLSSFAVGVVQRVTKWLPNEINSGRVDNVYWMLCVVCGLNLVYYLICARLYKYNSYRPGSGINNGDGDGEETT